MIRITLLFSLNHRGGKRDSGMKVYFMQSRKARRGTVVNIMIKFVIDPQPCHAFVPLCETLRKS